MVEMSKVQLALKHAAITPMLFGKMCQQNQCDDVSIAPVTGNNLSAAVRIVIRGFSSLGDQYSTLF